MSMATQRMYGRMTAVRGIEEVDHRANERYRRRTPELAIKEKLKVLREFNIVDDWNEAGMKKKMELAIAERPDIQCDRVLDGFARQLISEKLGG